MQNIQHQMYKMRKTIIVFIWILICIKLLTEALKNNEFCNSYRKVLKKILHKVREKKRYSPRK